MPHSSRIRTRATRSLQSLTDEKLNEQEPRKWERIAHIGTIASAFAAIAALAASTYQFKENLRVQEQAASLQAQAIQVERSAKAGEIFERYMSIRAESPSANLSRKARSEFYAARNNRALIVLNAMYATTKGDPQWEGIVSSSMYHFVHVVRARQVACEPLTKDFRMRIQQTVSEATIETMCMDYYLPD